ncbi:uncharacterized protein LOC135167123 [Diachasmimorpha longicaudata]|uniref:uncharacterized protein LOC135167123 n=1 Tax=Diachasmimorpha longicaudata TaxID=58733 RepID=UPI0030B90378
MQNIKPTQSATNPHARNMECCNLYTIALILFVVLVIYKYLTRNNGYWKAQGIPEAKGGIIGIGHVLDQLLLRKNMGMMSDVFYKAHPHDSMVGIYVAQTPVLVVRHPDLVKFILSSGFTYFSDNITLDKKTDPLLFHDPFFQNGQAWKDARGVFVSAFSAKKLKDRIPAISATCEKLVNYLREEIGKNGSIELEMKDLFEKYTLEVGASAVLGIDGHTFIDKIEPYSLRNMMHSMFKITDLIGYGQNLIILLPALGKLFSTSFAPKWVNVRFKRMVEDIKAMRGGDKTSRNDILQHIIDYLREKGLDSDELAAHAFSFVVEQYETSSSTLALMSYYAAKYPNVQDKMRKEVEEILKTHGSICTYEAINSMTYIEQVAKECLRMFTPVGRMSRLCSKQVTLEGPDGLTCTLRPGTEVYIPVASLHKDSQYWENPEEFMPERFDKDYEEQRHKFVFLPFGEGPRMCPGMRMGLLQVKAGMAAILMNYVMEKSDRMNEPARLDPRYFLTAIHGGVWVRLRSRTHSIFGVFTSHSEMIGYVINQHHFIIVARTVVACESCRKISTMEWAYNIAIALVVVFILLLYRYLTRNYGYWKARGIPVPPGVLPGVGHLLPSFIMKKSIITVLEDIYRDYSKSSMVGIYMMGEPVLLIKNPDLVKTILQTQFNNFRHHSTMEGDFNPLMDQNPFALNDQKWKNARSVFLSTMTSRKLKALSLILRDGCSKFIKYLNNELEGKSSVDFDGKALFKKVTIEVSANAVLSIEEGMFNDNSPPIFKDIMEAVFAPTIGQTIRVVVIMLVPSLERVLKLGFVPEWVTKRFTKILDNLIEERESGKIKRDDILQHLIEYRAEKNLSQASVTSTVFAFFLESYETSSLTMSFLACDLAQYPEVQDKLREEINSVASKFGGEIPYEAISEMNYLDQVMSESMRLHPVAGFLRKLCSEETELVGPDGLRTKMKPKDVVVLPVYGLHKDPAYWDRPNEFRPERFDKESEEYKQRHNYVYLPFGEGPRMCPGMRMAIMIVKLIIVNLVKNFVIEKSPKLREPVVLDPMSFLPYIKGGAWIRLRHLT